MAIYTKKAQPTKNDLYETPTTTLDMILDHLDPKRHLIWEPFVGTGHSTRYIKSRGFSVTNGDHQDFFQQSLPEKDPEKDLVLISNPPFSVKRQILLRLTDLGFHKIALLLPAPVLFTKYFQEYCSHHQVQVIIHTKRCNFLDPETGKPTLKQPTFDVMWVCVDLALERDILFSAESSQKDETAKASQNVKTC